MTEELVQITVSYACFGLVVVDGIVIDAPPIARWTIGKSIDFVRRYYHGR